MIKCSNIESWVILISHSYLAPLLVGLISLCPPIGCFVVVKEIKGNILHQLDCCIRLAWFLIKSRVNLAHLLFGYYQADNFSRAIHAWNSLKSIIIKILVQSWGKVVLDSKACAVYIYTWDAFCLETNVTALMSVYNVARKQLDRFEIGGFINAKFVPEDRLQTKMAANHDEDSVSNKSHSAHNWHLRSALMQAINVSWYQAVCRETPWVTDCSPAKIAEAAPPLILPSVSECDVRLEHYCNPLFRQNLFFCRKEITHIWNFRKLLMRDNSKESKW